ncbi:MAG: hypothetical protein EZS28_045522 [Streblomastix strix]|uniref:Uncharacterized protein n=1 Tax=Streblomastix strix TaxID=222440 RepID=A0A5J4TNG0_9EUKA|nr:MAG: hypothetical protein EZS28_045522 [Streblomastix strix]
MFNFDQPIPANGKKNGPNSKRISVVCVGAAVDSQTAKQTVQANVESGVFTYNFTQLIKQNPSATFKDLEAYCIRNIKKYQTIQLTASDPSCLTKQMIVNKK